MGGRGKPISEDLKNLIISAWQRYEQSYGYLAKTFNIPKSTVHSIVSKFKEKGSTANKDRPGKARSTTGLSSLRYFSLHYNLPIFIGQHVLID